MADSRQYSQLTFDHANLNKKVKVILGTLASYMHSDKAACVCLFTVGGIVPVKQTMEEVELIINNAVSTAEKE